MIATLTCTFVARTDSGTKDAHGNVIWAITSRSVAGCVYAPGASQELLDNRDTVTADATLYAPTGTSVTAVDKITVPGYGDFEVLGTPDAWPPNPFTAWQPSTSVVIALRKVTG